MVRLRLHFLDGRRIELIGFRYTVAQHQCLLFLHPPDIQLVHIHLHRRIIIRHGSELMDKHADQLVCTKA